MPVAEQTENGTVRRGASLPYRIAATVLGLAALGLMATPSWVTRWGRWSGGDITYVERYERWWSPQLFGLNVFPLAALLVTMASVIVCAATVRNVRTGWFVLGGFLAAASFALLGHVVFGGMDGRAGAPVLALLLGTAVLTVEQSLRGRRRPPPVQDGRASGNSLTARML